MCQDVGHVFDFHITDFCPSPSTRTKQDSVRNARYTSCIQRLLFRIPKFKEMHAQVFVLFFWKRARGWIESNWRKGKRKKRRTRVPWAEPRADCSILVPAVYREMRAAASSQPPTRTSSAQLRRTSVAIKSARFRVENTSSAWVDAPPARHHLHRVTGSRRRAPEPHAQQQQRQLRSRCSRGAAWKHERAC